MVWRPSRVYGYTYGVVLVDRGQDGDLGPVNPIQIHDACYAEYNPYTTKYAFYVVLKIWRIMIS